MDDKLTHIGNFRIEHEIARDARRVLYRGWQTALGRPVQITHVTPEAAADAAFVARWKAAARDMQHPGHPGLPQILEGQFAGERLYLAERHVVGDTLADQAKTSRDLRAGIRLLYGLADTLAYAHRRGWAFGGVTPDDVCIAADGNAYLSDLPWHAANRAPGDAEAQRADVQSLGTLFLALMAPACGAAPELAADPQTNARTLADWLAPAAVSEPELAAAVAPAILSALDGACPDCGALVDALRPLVQGARPTPSAQPRPGERTRVEPPPAEQPIPLPPARQSTPAEWQPSPTPQPRWVEPVAQPPPMPPAPPVGTTTAPPRDIKKIAGIAAAIFLGLAILGVVLCRLEVLPFCVACDKGLIVEYLNAGTGYRTTGAWADAFRELDAGQTECDACRKKPGECSQITPLWAEAKCHGDSQRLVAEATTLLDDGQTCPAVQKLEEAQKLGCAPKDAEKLLVTGTEGHAGAYVPCIESLLNQAGQQSDPALRKVICDQVHGHLNNARGLKSAALTMNLLFERDDRYAALQKGLAAKDWTAATDALRQLESVAENGQYCGQNLKELWFDVYFGQGATAEQAGNWCEARGAYQAAEQAAQTLKQKDDAGEKVKEAYSRCSDTPTPTPSPTPTVAPTPTATPRPAAVVKPMEANLRTCPSASCSMSRKAKQGESFSVECAVNESDGLWYKILVSADSYSWLRQDMVRSAVTVRTCAPNEETPTPRPVPTRWCWFGQALSPEQIAYGLFEIRVRTVDAAGKPIARVRVQTWYDNTRYWDETNTNGEFIRAGISQWNIPWNICVDQVCIPTNATNTGQRVVIQFVRKPCQ